MALSSSEHELLVETCTNMNEAAGTCREVLEMLRNLGNTGVVDIATHNNATGRHADDDTIVHRSYDSSNNATIQMGLLDTSVGKYSIEALADGSKVERILKTYDSVGVKSAHSYDKTECLLTDSSGTRISFENETNVWDVGRYTNRISGYLIDSEGNSIGNAISFFPFNVTNSSQSGFTGDSSIGFACNNTSGSSTSLLFVFAATSDGIMPYNNNAVDIGKSSRKFKDIYLVNSPTVGSDRRLKADITTLGDSALSFVNSLRPVSYKLAEGTGAVTSFSEDDQTESVTPAIPGTRTHWGFIAQEVKEAMTQAGIEDAAVWTLADKNDPGSMQSLRYDELIAPLVKAVQVLAAKVAQLEAR